MSDAGKLKRLAVLLGMLSILPAAACAQGMMDGRGMMNGGMMNGGMMNGSSPRHVYFMRHGLPEKYANMANPLPASAKNIDAGKALYGQMCASCHGPAGRGDGAAGRALNPPPSDLARTVRMRMGSDGYLYWSIAEGGAAFSSAMPAMGGSWKPEQIWQVILYLRTF
ncbi:MAG TPA: cytochrome c [Gallionellaceae bacterium]|nr:cytochrome c [Gallionellaceae bacterium]